MRKNFGKDTSVYPMPVFIVAAYDKDGNPKNTDSCLTYLIEPATRKRLKEAKSLTKKAQKVAKYNKDVYTFLRGGFISENMNNALNYLLGD